jgi:hypothetical protein
MDFSIFPANSDAGFSGLERVTSTRFPQFPNTVSVLITLDCLLAFDTILLSIAVSFKDTATPEAVGSRFRYRDEPSFLLSSKSMVRLLFCPIDRLQLWVKRQNSLFKIPASGVLVGGEPAWLVQKVAAVFDFVGMSAIVRTFPNG